MIIEVKSINNKQFIEIMFNDEWERHDYLKSLESLFRVHDVPIKDKIYNLNNNSIIINELSNNQVKLLKGELEWIAFYKFNPHYYNIANSIKDDIDTKLKLLVLK